MATKATTKKRATAKRKTVAKKTNTKRKTMPIGLTTERCPENHAIKGKFVFFYCLFAFTTLVFAGLAVWLFFFSSKMLNQYESLEACARTHGASCELINYDSVDDTGVVEGAVEE